MISGLLDQSIRQLVTIIYGFPPSKPRFFVVALLVLALLLAAFVVVAVFTVAYAVLFLGTWGIAQYKRLKDARTVTESGSGALGYHSFRDEDGNIYWAVAP